MFTTVMPEIHSRPARTDRGAVGSGVLGVVASDRSMYGLAHILHGIEEAARRSGWETALSCVNDPRPAGELLPGSLLGLIALAPTPALEDLLAETTPGLPAVAVCAGESTSLPFVAIDHRAGARRATEHLLSEGGFTVWHVGGPEDCPEARERERGWREALESRDIRLPPVIRGDWSPRSGYDAGKILLHEPGVDAIFVANDQMALGVCRAYLESGRPVPDDVRVVGFDDIPVAAYVTPSLTTVRQNYTELGAYAVDVLAGRIATGQGAADGHYLTPELVVRASTQVERAEHVVRY